LLIFARRWNETNDIWKHAKNFNELKDIYLLSGLGADRRVFDYVDLQGFKLNHIDWIDPLEDEKIEAYAKRLLAQIPTNKPILIGVSFGGILAIEIGKLIEAEKIVLISSAKTRTDIPFGYRLAGNFWANKLIPAPLYRQANFIVYWLFGVKKKEEKELLKAIMDDADNDFVDWATNKIVNWDNERLLPNVVTVHGTSDRVLPFKSADYVVDQGGHMMIVTRAQEVSNILRKILT
jgi:pimeloyl-ACP methyl ester carboxylesterase